MTAVLLAGALRARAADAVPYTPFDGEKSTWHNNFDRFDNVMDEETQGFGELSCTRITWRGEERGDAGSGREFPSERMLAAAIANEENFHSGAVTGVRSGRWV